MLRLDDIALTQEGFSLTADFSVEAGAQVAILGPSGAGKSTLLGLIAGFIAPDRGRILWGDEDLTRAAPAQRPVSILFQDNNLFPHLSVAQNVGLGLRPSLKLSDAEQAQVADAIARVGLEGLSARKPAQLSGGQQSRVAIARVLVQRKPLILLDEPFAALGPALKHDMLGLMTDLARERGATLMTVTHDPGDLDGAFEALVLVHSGRAHPPQPTREVLENPPAAFAEYLGSRA